MGFDAKHASPASRRPRGSDVLGALPQSGSQYHKYIRMHSIHERAARARIRQDFGATCALLTTGAALAWLGACSSGSSSPEPEPEPTASPPNILFLILDDVGIDQLAIFNPAAPATVATPNIDAIAQAGVRFTNLWTMPECSPSRATIFTGRFPLRTGVDAAILPYDLPAAQVSPYEITTPMILANAGYTSALMGKFHLGGPDNNPDGFGTPAILGWDFYLGNLQGGPPFIDPTLGGQTADDSLFPCGFPLGEQRGACWFEGPGGTAIFDSGGGVGYTGHECLVLGGIPALCANGQFDLDCSDQGGLAQPPDFSTYSGYYAWPEVVNDAEGVRKSVRREYMTVTQTDAAISWIQEQSQVAGGGQPWMCTVSYDAIHSPYQQPPPDLYPPDFSWPKEVPEGCETSLQQRILGDLMLHAMDREIGRLLEGIGLATRGSSGELLYDPEASNTMVVLVGDNGTLVTSVRLPYDPLRAKGTPYQTGVLAPLVIAGPLVQEPGRAVDHLTSCADLFQLFGDIAGLDVRSLVPSSHALDCEPLLPYLTDPFQAAIRRHNFTELGAGTKDPAIQTLPCVLTIGPEGSPLTLCTDILFDTESLCDEVNGQWYGGEYQTCCQILEAKIYPNLIIVPTLTWAVRNDRYKLVKSVRAPCDTGDEFEFYDLLPTHLNPLGLDLSANDLLTRGSPLTDEEQANYGELQVVLQLVLDSEPVCHGDGNLDGIVDQQDLDGAIAFQGRPSVFDINHDGITDELDIDCILLNFGNVCGLGNPGTPCSRE